jgi:hypothetical protein
VIKSGKWGIAAFGGSTWSIERNYIKEDGARSNASNWGQSLLQRTPGGRSSHGWVTNNVCEGVGITFSGSDGLVAGNQVGIWQRYLCTRFPQHALAHHNRQRL